MTVALSRHALKNSFFFKILGIGFHLICPALIGVKRSSIRTINRDFDCFSLSFQYAFSRRMFRYSIADDFIVEHVQERIQIKLVQGQMSLCIYFIIFEF